jgi:hypothetical protein
MEKTLWVQFSYLLRDDALWRCYLAMSSTCFANMNVLLLASLLTITPPRYLVPRLNYNCKTRFKYRTGLYHFAREPGGGSIHNAMHVTLPTSLPTTANTCTKL